MSSTLISLHVFLSPLSEDWCGREGTALPQSFGYRNGLTQPFINFHAGGRVTLYSRLTDCMYTIYLLVFRQMPSEGRRKPYAGFSTLINCFPVSCPSSRTDYPAGSLLY